jgi:hypothetical protein
VDPNKTKGRIEEAEEKLNSNPHARDLVRTAVSRSLSRRSFLGRVSTSSVAAVAGVGASALLLSEKAKADGDDEEDSSRRARSYRFRLRAAKAERDVPPPDQVNNGDERRYHNFIGNYSQGLPHNSIGEVDPSAYEALLIAVHSGRPSDFANIPLGGNTKLQLNKLANNVALGRDMAGVHWRSDAEQALLLGEAVTISILRDQRPTYNEPFSGFTFTKFDGTTITV